MWVRLEVIRIVPGTGDHDVGPLLVDRLIRQLTPPQREPDGGDQAAEDDRWPGADLVEDSPADLGGAGEAAEEDQQIQAGVRGALAERDLRVHAGEEEHGYERD